MIPLPHSHLNNLLPIFDASLKELNLEERSSREHCLAKLHWGYGERVLEAYVDDIDNPKHVVAVGRMPSLVTLEMYLAVFFIYSAPEERGTPESLAAFAEQIHACAAVHNVDAIIGSDWRWGGSQLGTGAFWVKMGFELQERVYAKVLKKSAANVASRPVAASPYIPAR